MTHVTCRLTAKNRDQLRNPTLGNRVWVTFFTLILARSANFIVLHFVIVSRGAGSCFACHRASYTTLVNCRNKFYHKSRTNRSDGAESYSRSTCSKLRVSIVVSATHKFDCRRRVLLTTPRRNFSESRVRGKVPDGSILISEGT